MNSSRVLPRAPRIGDPFLGEIVRVYRDHPGLLISAAVPLYLPIDLLLGGIADNASLIGRWLECEVVRIDEKKRCIVVRQTAWADTDDLRRESQLKIAEYWKEHG